jgi:hypothetical protein
MTRDETVALFLQCEAKRSEARAAALAEGKDEDEASEIAHEAAKAHWNAWAEPLLAERKALEASGAWVSRREHFWEPETGGNSETQAWLDKAAADFSRCLFLLRGASSSRNGACAVSGIAKDEALQPDTIPARASLGRDDAKAEASEPPVKSIAIDNTVIDFRDFVFPGDARFDSAAFSGNAWFDTAAFSGDASFASAAFSGRAWFGSAAFSGDASFASAAFSGRAWFGSAAFSGDASFVSAAFSGDASFGSAAFSGDASFGSAAFSGNASFDSAAFSGNARFVSAAFSGDAWFASAAFSGYASFASAAFSGDARFVSAAFSGDASFDSAAFSGDASFGSAAFKSSASFRDCRFYKEAVFAGINAEKGFDFIGVRSRSHVPDFLSARFAEPPLLDNFRLGHGVEPGGLRASVLSGFWAWLRNDLDSALSAKYRRLKQLAIDSHDHKNEQIFFRGELRARRFLEDKPWHPAFWFGIVYEIVSEFGFSVLRPLAAWLLCIVIFAVYFLGQNPGMAAKRKELHRHGFFGQAFAYSKVALDESRKPRKPGEPYCYPGTPPKPGDTKPITDGFSGLVEEARATTNLINEAFSIAYHNALVVLDSNGDSAHRAFGCLYGVERYGGNPVAFVPRAVAIASGIQKLASAAFIFLFGLALRNLLKVK